MYVCHSLSMPEEDCQRVIKTLQVKFYHYHHKSKTQLLLNMYYCVMSQYIVCLELMNSWQDRCVSYKYSIIQYSPRPNYY